LDSLKSGPQKVELIFTIASDGNSEIARRYLRQYHTINDILDEKTNPKMKSIRGMKKARLALLLVPLLLASFIPPALAAPTYSPGVHAGDSWTYGDWSVSCTVFCPEAFFGPFPQIASLTANVQNVTGFNVGLNTTFTYRNGSSTSNTQIVSTLTGAGFLLIAGGLVKGDRIYNSTFSPTINDTVTRVYAGASRQVNFFESFQPQSTGNLTFTFYWDQLTGALLEINETVSLAGYVAGSGTATIHARVTSTNMWQATMPDFTLSATALSPAPISAGSSSTSTVTLTSLQGLAGPVNVSAKVLPTIGNTPAPLVNPPTVPFSGTTGQATLSITTSPSTVPGTYSVVVLANTTTVSHFISLALTVTGPDFSMSSFPTYSSIPLGGATTITITLHSLLSFTGIVALSAISVPPNNLQVSLSQSNVALAAGGSASPNLTIAVPTNAIQQSYTVLVTGTSGFLAHQVQIYVNVQPLPPPDINITASPSLLVFQPGSVGVSIITVTSLHGFTGTVKLSVNSQFVTADLSVNNLTLTPNIRTASALLTITAPEQAGPGDWNFYVYANGPGVYGQAQVTARLNPATPQFTMYASPGYFPNATPGTVENSKLSFNSFGGYADTLNLIPQSPTTSCEPSISPTVSTVQLPAGGTVYANATINVPSCTSPGDYVPTLWATGTQQPLYYETGTFLRVNGTSTRPDFTLTTTPRGIIGVPTGSEANFTVTVKSINGFSGPVTVVPNGGLGQVVTPSTFSLTPGSSQNLTVSVGVSNGYGGCCFGLGVLATSGAISHTTGTTISLNVTNPAPGPAFTLTASPGGMQLVEGHPQNVTVTVGSTGFYGTVNLSSQFDPQHFTVKFSQSSVTLTTTNPTAMVQMTINNSTSDSVGAWTIMVSGRGGTVLQSVQVQLNVTSTTAPDFRITSSPSDLLLLERTYGKVDLTVTSINGFTGNVLLLGALVANDSVFLSPGSVVKTTLWILPTDNLQAGVNYGFGATGISGTTIRGSTILVDITLRQDFAIKASPTSLSFLAGSSGSSTLTVSSLGGFTGTVSLAAKSYPSGLSVSPGANSIVVPANGQNTAGVLVGGSVPGSYVVVVDATSGGVTRSVAIPVTITQVTQFSITANPASLTIQQGGQSSTKITVKSLNGFSGEVSLSAYAFNFPQVSLSASSVTLSPGGNANVTLTIPVPSNAGTGLYQVPVSANSSATSAFLIVQVNVTPAANNFILVAKSPFLTILPGAQGTDVIFVNAISNGLNATVTLTNSTLTPLVHCNLNPASVTLTSTMPSLTSSLTCSGSTPGTYSVTITGTSNGEQHSTDVIVFVPRTAYLPGVSVGNTFTLQKLSVTWSSSIPASIFPEPSALTLLNNTDHIDILVTAVSGTNVTFRQTWVYSNGTVPAVGYITVNVATGAFNTTGVLPTSPSNGLLAKGLQALDHIYADPFSPTINMTATRNLLGVIRTVNFLNMTNTSPYGTFSDQNEWDQMSGILVGASANITFNLGPSGTAKGSFTAALTKTNTWTATSTKPSVTIISATPNPANTGQQVTVNFGVSNPTAVTSINVNWGDGTTDTLSATAISDTHTYANTGSQTSSAFTINVTATNSAGHGSATATETVNDRPPAVTISTILPNPATTSQIVTVAFSATDPDGTIASYTVNWGDASASNGLPGTATSDTHSYSSAGSFTITVTATDNSGSTGTSSKSITVNGPGKTTASLSVSCSLNSIASGASTSCTVTVTGSSIYPPSGVVTLSTNSTTGAFTPSTGTCTLNTYGACSVTYTDTATSSRTALISAAYPGDTYNTGATGGFSLKVVKSSTGLTTASLTVACSASTIQVGSFTTCTASVAGSTPTGSVTLSTSSGTGYFTPSNGQCTLASGSCAVTYTDTATANVTVRIYAQYAGDTYNTVAYTNFTLTLVKPSNTLATATTPVTITSGTATADQTATTGIYVQITGSTATNGTPAAISTKDLSAPSMGVGTVSLSGAKFYDVVVAGTTSGNAKVCINDATATSTTTMQYWSGTAWTDATGVTVNGATVCGQIPVSALTGTNIAVGNAVQPVSPTTSSNNLLLIIAGIAVAVVIVVVVAAVFLRRRGRSTIGPQRP